MRFAVKRFLRKAFIYVIICKQYMYLIYTILAIGVLFLGIYSYFNFKIGYALKYKRLQRPFILQIAMGCL